MFTCSVSAEKASNQGWAVFCRFDLHPALPFGHKGGAVQFCTLSMFTK